MGGTITHQAAMAIDLAAKRAALMQWFGIGRREADTLASLAASMGEPLTAQHLAANCGSTPESIAQAIHHLRAAMLAEAIDFFEGGYMLTEIGRRECADALAEMRLSLGRRFIPRLPDNYAEGLTDRQAKFIAAYVVSLNAAAAAQAAGYSPKRAAQAGWNILRLPKVRAILTGVGVIPGRRGKSAEAMARILAA